MQAIILAAGVGRRLQPFTYDRPKCLARFGGQSLLARHLNLLRAFGITQINLIVGYFADQIKTEAATQDLHIPIEFILNPAYERGSAVSLIAAQKILRNHSTLVMDADLLYDQNILRLIVETEFENAMLVDRRLDDTSEEVKAIVREQRVWGLGKHVSTPGQVAGESLGIFRFSPRAGTLLADGLQRLIDQSGLDTEYETGIHSSLPEYRMDYIDIDGLPWIEIDTPADLQRAEASIFPTLEKFNRRS